jgi:hypothetical protein
LALAGFDSYAALIAEPIHIVAPPPQQSDFYSLLSKRPEDIDEEWWAGGVGIGVTVYWIVKKWCRLRDSNT